MNRNSGQNMLLRHSYSTNDASLEYKHTVNVGQYNIKITGVCLDLVRIAKLVLDDYFSKNEFEAGINFESSQVSTPLRPFAPSMIPQSHQISSSPFVDSGINLDLLSPGQNVTNNILEADDDVFTVDNDATLNTSTSTVLTSTPMNRLTRSRRNHFSRRDSTPKTIKDKTNKDSSIKIVYEYERLLHYRKSPHSWALPRDWKIISGKSPPIFRNKDDRTTRFDPAVYLTRKLNEINVISSETTSELE